MKYSHIIWDFNGTILDDVTPCIDVLNTMLEKRKLGKISKEMYLDVFGFPIKSYYEKLGFDFTKENYGVMAIEWSGLYKAAAENSGICKGVEEALEYFKKLELPQYILSATEYSMLKEQIKALGIGSYFTELLALKDFHAVSKVSLGREWAEKVKPQRMLFIGDTLHDYETAVAMGAECVLIAAGHQSRDRLLKCGVPVINSAEELIPYFEKCN
ncbi:MAG: HAD family hydrolase [Ruminococcaceae bacterium]|nr:HAD family hydrolase [Oscillospiraceae bacterium]